MMYWRYMSSILSGRFSASFPDDLLWYLSSSRLTSGSKSLWSLLSFSSFPREPDSGTGKSRRTAGSWCSSARKSATLSTVVWFLSM